MAVDHDLHSIAGLLQDKYAILAMEFANTGAHLAMPPSY
jgi:hypothetical protein